MPQQRWRRRPPQQRHHFHWRTPWLQIFADEMLERARALALRERQHRHERDDFSDQVEAAERLFAGFEERGNDWGDEDDDDLPSYVGDIEM